MEPLALGSLGLPVFSPRSRHVVLLQPTGLRRTQSEPDICSPEGCHVTLRAPARWKMRLRIWPSFVLRC